MRIYFNGIIYYKQNGKRPGEEQAGALSDRGIKAESENLGI